MAPKRLPPADPSFFEQYAFDTARNAYDHGLSANLTRGLTLRADSQSGGSAVGHGVPITVPHQDEVRDASAKDDLDFIWVGMCPKVSKTHKDRGGKDKSAAAAAAAAGGGGGGDGDANDDDAAGDDAKKINKEKDTRFWRGTAVGDLHPLTANKIAHTAEALRVVFRKNKAEGYNTFHVLVDQDQTSHLCVARRVPMDQVFFFKAFRDDSLKNAADRKKDTFQKIVNFIRSGPAPLPATESAQAMPLGSTPVTGRLLGTAFTSCPPTGYTLSGQDMSAPMTPQSLLLGYGSIVSTPQHSFGADAAARASSALAQQVDALSNSQQSIYPAPEPHNPPSPFAKKQVMPAVPSAGSFDNRFEALLRTDFDDSVALSHGSHSPVANAAVQPQAANAENENAMDIDDEFHDRSKSPNMGERCEVVADRVRYRVKRLVEKFDMPTLHALEYLTDSLNTRDEPREGAALAIRLNVELNTDEEYLEDECADRLDELKELWPSLQHNLDLDPAIMYWMYQGLQDTSQTIDIQLIKPFVEAFHKQVIRQLGEEAAAERPLAIKDKKLYSMIMAARTDAEAWLRAEQVDRGRDEIEGDQVRWRAHYLD